MDGLYDNNLNCTWYVTSSGTNVIDMTFIYIDIEPNYDKCDLDFLKVSTVPLVYLRNEFDFWNDYMNIPNIEI